MREERQWLMASGEFVPDELKVSFNKWWIKKYNVKKQ